MERQQDGFGQVGLSEDTYKQFPETIMFLSLPSSLTYSFSCLFIFLLNGGHTLLLFFFFLNWEVALVSFMAKWVIAVQIVSNSSCCSSDWLKYSNSTVQWNFVMMVQSLMQDWNLSETTSLWRICLMHRVLNYADCSSFLTYELNVVVSISCFSRFSNKLMTTTWCMCYSLTGIVHRYNNHMKAEDKVSAEVAGTEVCI